MNDEEKKKIAHNIQALEQNLQMTILQKQAFQIELEEVHSTLKELEKSEEEVFKLIGQLMIKSDKKTLISELLNKEKLIDLRIRNLEKQEKLISEKIEEIKKNFK